MPDMREIEIVNSTSTTSSGELPISLRTSDDAANRRRTAPIVLFVYNRPLHTEKTLAALRGNELAGASDLFIYSDAPKNAAASEAVARVRELIRNVAGFRSVSVIEQEQNRGLASSIISGVTHLCKDYGRAIVLEDDLVTSPYFLRYMNDALDLYENTNEVMHVSGGTYPVGTFGSSSTYFLHLPLCWGWGTWARAWSAFEKDVAVMARFDSGMIRKFNFDNTYGYWDQLELNVRGKINTWFVFWYAA